MSQIITQCYKKKNGLSQKRDQPILVVIGSQNKSPLADFLDNSYARDIPVWSLEFQQFRYYINPTHSWKLDNCRQCGLNVRGQKVQSE